MALLNLFVLFLCFSVFLGIWIPLMGSVAFDIICIMCWRSHILNVPLLFLLNLLFLVSFNISFLFLLRVLRFLWVAWILRLFFTLRIPRILWLWWTMLSLFINFFGLLFILVLIYWFLLLLLLFFVVRTRLFLIISIILWRFLTNLLFFIFQICFLRFMLFFTWLL